MVAVLVMIAGGLSVVRALCGDGKSQSSQSERDGPRRPMGGGGGGGADVQCCDLRAWPYAWALCLLRGWLALAMAWPLPRSVQGGGAGDQSWEEAALQKQASEQLRRQI